MPRSWLCCERSIFCISVIRKRLTAVFSLCISNKSVDPLFSPPEKRQPPLPKPPALRAVVIAPARQKRRCFLPLLPLTLVTAQAGILSRVPLPHNRRTASTRRLVRWERAALSFLAAECHTALDRASWKWQGVSPMNCYILKIVWQSAQNIQEVFRYQLRFPFFIPLNF